MRKCNSLFRFKKWGGIITRFKKVQDVKIIKKELNFTCILKN